MTACVGKPGYLPKIQFQNPVLSDDPYGWSGCTAYAAGMAGDFDTCGQTVLSGKRVRQLSSEPIPDPASPGLNLRQVDDALNRYGIDLETRYRLPWADFVRKIEKGEGAILQGATGPFLSTPFRSTSGDINHAIFVPPGWGAMDPAADGRRPGIHRYDGRPYPKDLLRRFAGHLLVGSTRLGNGYVYAAFTRDRRSTWYVQIGPNHRFAVFDANDANRTCVYVRRSTTDGNGSPRWDCTPPRTYRNRKGETRILVRLLEGRLKDRYVNVKYSTEVP